MKLFKKILTGILGLTMAAGLSACGGAIGSTFNEQKADFYESSLITVEKDEKTDYAVDLCFAWNASNEVASKFEAKAKYLLIKIEGKDSELSLDRIKVSLKAEDGADGKYVEEKYRSAIEILPFVEKDLEDARISRYISEKDIGNKYTNDPKRALKVRVNLTELCAVKDIEKLFSCDIFTMKFDLSNGIVSTIDSKATLKWEYRYNTETKVFVNNTYKTGIEVKGCKDKVLVGEEYTVGDELKVNLIYNQGPSEELEEDEYEMLVEVDTSVAGEGKVTFTYSEFESVVIKVLVVEPEPEPSTTSAEGSN